MILLPNSTAGTSETCNQRTHICTDEFTGNTMGQAGLDGELLFLHSNMHKWDLRLPEKFDLHYQRRWARMLPGACLEGTRALVFVGVNMGCCLVFSME